MIKIDEDLRTIHLTRGDATHDKYNRLAFCFPIYNFETEETENYVFQLNDKITLTVFEKKGYTKRELLKKEYTLKDLGYTEGTEYPELILTEEETKLFELANKRKTYWYSIELNDTTTIFGYDGEGAEKLIVYPGIVEEIEEGYNE